jgi:hypothetical protein
MLNRTSSIQDAIFHLISLIHCMTLQPVRIYAERDQYWSTEKLRSWLLKAEALVTCVDGEALEQAFLGVSSASPCWSPFHNGSSSSTSITCATVLTNLQVITSSVVKFWDPSLNIVLGWLQSTETTLSSKVTLLQSVSQRNKACV